MEKTQTKTFNPNDHLTNIKGKDYLEVKWRLVWFREEHKDWGIETEVSDRGDGWALMKAYVKDDMGRVLATGHKSETKGDFGDYLEKAETGAIGRALALLGYGTQFAPELEEGERIVDSPVDIKSPQNAPQAPTGASRPEGETLGICPKCKGGQIVERTAKTTGKKFWGCSAFPGCDYVSWTKPEVVDNTINF